MAFTCISPFFYLCPNYSQIIYKSHLYSANSLRGLFNKHICRNSAMSSTGYATVTFVTAPIDEARKLSKQLVENRLAACVNIVQGVESVYEWKGTVEHDNETIMIIKSQSSKSFELAEFVRSNHPYECPEVVTIKVDSGSESYLHWLQQTVNQKPMSSQIKESLD